MTTEKTTLSLSLAEEDVERVIQETIRAQVAAAFAARGGEMAAQVVSSFMHQGVDYHGNPSGAPARRGERTYVHKVIGRALSGAMESCVREWIAENNDALRKLIVTQLNRQKTKIASQLCASLIDSAKSAYRCKVSVQLGIPDTEE